MCGFIEYPGDGVTRVDSTAVAACAKVDNEPRREVSIRLTWSPKGTFIPRSSGSNFTTAFPFLLPLFCLDEL